MNSALGSGLGSQGYQPQQNETREALLAKIKELTERMKGLNEDIERIKMVLPLFPDPYNQIQAQYEQGIRATLGMGSGVGRVGSSM